MFMSSIHQADKLERPRNLGPNFCPGEQLGCKVDYPSEPHLAMLAAV
jgi:hypothetical protein